MQNSFIHPKNYKYKKSPWYCGIVFLHHVGRSLSRTVGKSGDWVSITGWSIKYEFHHGCISTPVKFPPVWIRSTRTGPGTIFASYGDGTNPQTFQHTTLTPCLVPLGQLTTRIAYILVALLRNIKIPFYYFNDQDSKKARYFTLQAKVAR
jgi:hypothetical protein